MTSSFKALLIILMTALTAVPAFAQGIETRAEYAIMMDADTGTVLFEKDPDMLMSPSSMAKLMTLAVLFQKLKEGSLTLDDTFPVSERAWALPGMSGGSEMFVLVNTEIRIEDLIRGIIVSSGNDACIVVAEGISGTEEAFADEMTRYARDIGMEKSTFVNSSGWPHPDQKMTARELAILSIHLIQEYPDLYKYFAELEFTWSNITQPNRNPLLYANVPADGLKTGHTQDGGYGLVASGVEDGRRLVLVVNGLGSENARSTESQRLMRIGFRDFKPYDLFKGGETIGSAKVWQGEKADVALMIKDPLQMYMRPQDRRRMKVTINYNGPIAAPIMEGDEVAELRIHTPGKEPHVMPLYAAESVGPMGIFGKMGAALIDLIIGQMEESPAS